MKYAFLGLVCVIAACDKPFGLGEPIIPGVSIQYVQQDTPVAGKRFSGGVNVNVRDADGKPQSRVPVTFATAAGSGTVDQQTVLTNIYGHAHVEWTLDTHAGPQTLQILVDGHDPRTVTVTAFAGPVATLDILADSVVLRGLAASIPALAAFDEFGNPRAPGLVTWISRDQSIVQVRDSQLVPIAPGTTWVVAVATTQARDSARVIVPAPPS